MSRLSQGFTPKSYFTARSFHPHLYLLSSGKRVEANAYEYFKPNLLFRPMSRLSRTWHSVNAELGVSQELYSTALFRVRKWRKTIPCVTCLKTQKRQENFSSCCISVLVTSLFVYLHSCTEWTKACACEQGSPKVAKVPYLTLHFSDIQKS